MTDDVLYYCVLKYLEDSSHITQRQLAEALGMSLGETNYMIKPLLDARWLKLGKFKRANNKMGYAYSLTRKA
jgi:DNA-binding Lrp family transcriptional regulator